MADTPSANAGETVVVDDSKTTVPVTAPATVTSNDGEVEKLRKEKEQAEMRANQLANQLKAREEADAEAKAKELEEQNKFKDLYEQEKAKREAVETEAEAKERLAAIAKAKDEVLGEYSDEVKKQVEALGLDLADTDEASVNSFKEKVAILDKGTASTKIGGNNQPVHKEGTVELSPDELKEVLRTPDGLESLIQKKYPGIAMMTSPKR